MHQFERFLYLEKLFTGVFSFCTKDLLVKHLRQKKENEIQMLHFS